MTSSASGTRLDAYEETPGLHFSMVTPGRRFPGPFARAEPSLFLQEFQHSLTADFRGVQMPQQARLRQPRGMPPSTLMGGPFDSFPAFSISFLNFVWLPII